MQSTRNIKHQPAAHGAMIVLAAMALSAGLATSALAAGHGLGGGGLGGGAHSGGHMGGRFRGPLVNSVPAMPGPTFNSSSPYTVPQGRETPVSPGSPGSVFGDR